MKRKCILLPGLEEFKREFSEFRNMNIDIYIDIENAEGMINIIETKKKKFRLIIRQVLSGKYNNDIYGKENFNEKTKDITAMKFKGGDNERIYCKEFKKLGKRVVMITEYYKKSYKLTKEIKNLLESISEYEYDFK